MSSRHRPASRAPQVLTHRLSQPLLAVAIAACFTTPAAAQVPGDTALQSSSGARTLSLESGSTLVDPRIDVTSSVDIVGGTVQIGTGQQPEDALSCDAAALALACSFNAGTGVLTISGSAPAADWEDTLRSVRLTTTSLLEEPRTIVFTLGTALPFRGPDHLEDHYYEFVNPCDGAEGQCGRTWHQAKDAAAARTLFGLQGYLATITSQAENDLIASKLAGDGWIGSSDDYREINAVTALNYPDQSGAEGNWHWVTGPEAGTLFSIWNAPVSANYQNWAFLEPNNYPLPEAGLPDGEYYGQIYSSGGGFWNDLLSEALLGYVVEYGGSDGDPVVAQLSASKLVNVTAASEDTGARRSYGGNSVGPVWLMLLVVAGALRRTRRRAEP